MSCLWFTCDVTSCHYNSARAEETLNYTRIRNWFWGFERNLDSDARSSNRPIVNWRLRTEPTFTQIPTRKVMRSTSRHTSTIEHGDVCSSCCNQMACEDLVLPWYLSGRGAENAMKTQAQIPLVPGNNLGKCDRWRAFKKEPDVVKEQTCLGKTYKWAAWPSSYHSRPVRFQDHVLFAIQVK